MTLAVSRVSDRLNHVTNTHTHYTSASDAVDSRQCCVLGPFVSQLGSLGTLVSCGSLVWSGVVTK